MTLEHRSDLSSETAQFAPPLPIAKRLNRNALTVVAILMFVTVLVAVVTTRTTRSEHVTPPTDAASVPAVPAQPSFLDVPVRRDSTGAFPGLMSRSTGDTALAAPGAATSKSVTPAPEGMTGASLRGVANPYLTPPPSVPPAVAPAVEAYRRALRSPVVAMTGNVGPVNASSRSAGASMANSDSLDEQLLHTLLGQGVLSTQSVASNPPTAPTPSGGEPLPPTDVPARVALSGAMPLTSARYQLDAGTVIPAALMTAVNSDLPGQLLAAVTRHVYDSRTQRVVVVPQGTRLLGRYDNAVGTGQQRLLIIWTRMMFPDGRSLTLPDVGTSDTRGAMGIAGEVDHHSRRVFGNALLLSVLSAGLQLSQPAQGGLYAAPTARQVAAGAVGQQLGDVATEMIRKNLEIPPTVTLPVGTPMNVFLRGDVVLPEAGMP